MRTSRICRCLIIFMILIWAAVFLIIINSDTKATAEKHEKVEKTVLGSPMVDTPPVVMEDPPQLYDITPDEAKSELSTAGVYIPEDYIRYCEQYGEEYSVSPEMLEAIIWSESRCQPLAENGICKGLMQLNIKYWLDKGSDWRNPAVNIEAGAKAINTIITNYGCEDLGSILTRFHGEKDFDTYSCYTKQIARISYLLERCHNK